MLPVKKIYVDSNHKTKDSKSSTNFKIDLGESFTMPENTAFFIDDIIIPSYKFLLINKHRDTLAISYRLAGATFNFTVIRLEHGDYVGDALASEIKKRLNIALSAAIYFHASFDHISNKITLEGRPGFTKQD